MVTELSRRSGALGMDFLALLLGGFRGLALGALVLVLLLLVPPSFSNSKLTSSDSLSLPSGGVGGLCFFESRDKDRSRLGLVIVPSLFRSTIVTIGCRTSNGRFYTDTHNITIPRRTTITIYK